MRSRKADKHPITEAMNGRPNFGHGLGNNTDTEERQLMEEQEGGQLMDEWVAMEPSPELTQDIRRLQNKIGDALDFYYKLRDKHGEQGGWEMVEDKLTLAIGWAESPIQLIPEEE